MVVQKAVILGGGSQAVTLAMALLRSGFSTTLIEADPDAAERVRFFLGRLQTGQGANVVSDVTALHTADIVFEAIDDDAGLRSQTLIDLKPHLPDQALLATTDLRNFPAALHGQRLIGFHLFAPADIRRLVEITPGPETKAQTLQEASDLAREMGRVPVSALPARASIGTRLERRLCEVTEMLLLRGAIPHELDEAMVAFGFDMGAFEAQDLTGLELAYGDRKRTNQPSLISDRMVQEGRLGNKVGVGWYRYPGGGGAVFDPLVEDLIREEARFAGVETREFSAEAMQQKIVQALRDEGTALLADRTAANAADIDIVSIHGLGFPAALGGVMAYKA